MERETRSSCEEQRKTKIGPREGSTKKEVAEFYILRGWLLRVFGKADELNEAVTIALRASVGWLLDVQDGEALEVVSEAGELFEVMMTGIRGRRARKAAQEEYHLLIGELIGALDGAQDSLLRSAAVQLLFYSGVTGGSGVRARRFEQAYQMMCALEAEGALRVPMRVRSAILAEAAHLRRRRQPEEAAALYEQVVRMGEACRKEAADPDDLSLMRERRLLLFHAWDAASSLYLMDLRRLRLLRAAKGYLRMMSMCGEYLRCQLQDKLGWIVSEMKETAVSLTADARFHTFLFGMMMALLFMMAYMSMNR